MFHEAPEPVFQEPPEPVFRETPEPVLQQTPEVPDVLSGFPEQEAEPAYDIAEPEAEENYAARRTEVRREIELEDPSLLEAFRTKPWPGAGSRSRRVSLSPLTDRLQNLQCPCTKRLRSLRCPRTIRYRPQ